MRSVAKPLSDRRFFIAAALFTAALVFAGFTRSYYLRSLFGLPPLSAFLHIHGLVMTAWVGLLCTQVGLVAARKVEWHRRLGIAGMVFAALVVVLGSMATLRAAAREVSNHSAEASMRIVVLGLELTQILLFAGLVTAAFLMRRRSDYHKRFMLLAMLAMLPNPLSRLPIVFDSNIAILLMFDALVIAAVAWDTLRRRRLHPAFGWGGALLIGVLHIAYVVAYSAPWHQFATWLVT